MPKSSVTIACLCIVTALVGCAPRVRVRKNPTDHDTGVRYYRPKPYLLITPAVETAGSGEAAVSTPSDKYVTLELKYLPDFSEEYSINVSPGLGVANVEISLEEGWNLTGINQQLDSKFSENLQAVGSLIGAVAPKGLIGTADEGETPPGTVKQVVAARNIPIGFYESVIGKDGGCRGKKRLYGWRYVGFAPYNACPLDASCGGSEHIACNDGSLNGVLYGLTFINGVMVFKPLHRFTELTPEGAAMTEITIEPIPEQLTGAQKSSIVAKIAAALGGAGISAGTNTIVSDNSTTEEISVAITFPALSSVNEDSVRALAIEAAQSVFPGASIQVEVTTSSGGTAQNILDLPAFPVAVQP